MSERDPAPHPHRVERGANLCVLTVSDTRTEQTDASGRHIRRVVERHGHRVLDHALVPDDPRRVRATIDGWLEREDCDGVVVNGGTGIAPRDTTYEAVDALLERRLDGFGELFRMLSFREVGSRAMLSRAVAGVARGRFVFSLPGSTAAVELAMEQLILPELPHLLHQLERRSRSS